MPLPEDIKIGWIGYKRNVYNRGCVWGYLIDMRNNIQSYRSHKSKYMIFSGKLGKNLIFIPVYDNSMRSRVDNKRGNYKEISEQDLLKKFKGFYSEVGMYLLIKRLKDA
jgi:hypothetical protein